MCVYISLLQRDRPSRVRIFTLRVKEKMNFSLEFLRKLPSNQEIEKNAKRPLFSTILNLESNRRSLFFKVKRRNYEIILEFFESFAQNESLEFSRKLP